MRLDVTKKDDCLLLRYEVRNEHGEDLFLCNLVPDTPGFYRPAALRGRMAGPALRTSELAYACFVAPDRAAFLQGVVPWPRDYRGTTPVIPFFTKVGPGEAFGAVIRARLPLLEWHAYAQPTSEWEQAALVSRVSLRVDYSLRSAARYLLALDVPEGAYQVRQAGEMPSFRAEVALDEPVSMLVRGDAFTRFA